MEKVGDRIRKSEEIITLKPERLPLDPLVLEVGDLKDPIIAKMLMPCRVLYDGLDLGIECVERPSVTDRKSLTETHRLSEYNVLDSTGS